MKKLISIILSAVMLASNIAVIHAEEEKLLAFPGAEGGGKYTMGARADSKPTVYHVTNLNAEGEGSFADAVSEENRIIVFDVGGTINLTQKLKIQSKNLTILGQTAPGDGITIAGADVELCADNIIMRYMRIRPSDINGGEPDGLGGRWINNIIIDHCSVSWCVDEGITLYAGSFEKEGKTPSSNTTVQYCISSESLRMSNHIKGAHGYGGIMGGTYATHHHNLFAHNDSRNPRLDRNAISSEIVNNVVYNWGINVPYGAEPYSSGKVEEFSTPEYVSSLNIIGCYYKAGPTTQLDRRSRIFEVTNDGSVEYEGEMLKSNFYIAENFVEGYPEASENNWLSNDVIIGMELGNRLDSPVDMSEYAVNPQTASEAFDDVLKNAGATLPKRDAIDARVVADVRNGTGRVVNSIEEIGGHLPFEEVTREFVIPEDWKAEMNMGDALETDIVPDGEFKGYTWIEAYVNDWTEEQSAPTNPEIKVISPVISSLETTIDKTDGKGSWTVLTAGEELEYSAKVTAVSDTEITKVELYDGYTLIDTFDSSDVTTALTPEIGTHYYFIRAYNNKGESTNSDTAIVYVNPVSETDFNLTQIGGGSFAGKEAFANTLSAELTDYSAINSESIICGSGKIGSQADSATFAYKKLTGDFDIIIEPTSIPKYENGVLSGIMARTSLNPDSAMAIIADGWLKYGENIRVLTRMSDGEEATDTFLPLEDGTPSANPSSNPYEMPKFMRMQRVGNTLTLSVSNSGESWTDNVRQPLELDITAWGNELYVGIATDSGDGPIITPYFTQASFVINKLDHACTALKLGYDENGVLISAETEDVTMSTIASAEAENNTNIYCVSPAGAAFKIE